MTRKEEIIVEIKELLFQCGLIHREHWKFFHKELENKEILSKLDKQIEQLHDELESLKESEKK